MASKIDTPDQRMLALMEWAINEGIAVNESKYLEMISFPRTNISNIRTGHQKFNRRHIFEACKLTGANANWILGLESQMMRNDPKRKNSGKTPMQLLREAVVMIDQELKTK